MPLASHALRHVAITSASTRGFRQQDPYLRRSRRAYVSLTALQYEIGSNEYFPSHYTGYARETLTVAAGSETQLDFVLEGVSEHLVTGAVAEGANLLMLWIDGLQFWDPFVNLESGYSLMLPAGLETKPLIELTRLGGGGQEEKGFFEVDDNVQELDLTLPAATQMIAPLPGATGVADDQVFSWTAGFAGVHVVSISSGGTWVRIATERSEVSIPKGTTLGGPTGSWSITSRTGTVDQEATLTGIPYRGAQGFGAATASAPFELAP